MIKVGITGGIGSGKTYISSIIETMGYPVYYADDRGKWLTNNDPSIQVQIKKLFDDSIYTSEGLNRAKVASIVFNEKDKLHALNAIIHPAVALDFKNWLLEHDKMDLIFKEAAILFESGANKTLDKVICVTAPEKTRIERVTKRDGTNEEQVIRRIQNQMDDTQRTGLSDYVIYNDGKQFVKPQIQEIINKIQNAQKIRFV